MSEDLPDWVKQLLEAVDAPLPVRIAVLLALVGNVLFTYAANADELADEGFKDYVRNMIKSWDQKSTAGAIARSIPKIFDLYFGKIPSWKFVWRSCFLSCVVMFSFAYAKHNLIKFMFLFLNKSYDQEHNFRPNSIFYITEYIAPSIISFFMLLSDMVCIAKSRFFMGKSESVSRYSQLVMYFIGDIVATFLIVELFLFLSHFTVLLLEALYFGKTEFLVHFPLLLAALCLNAPKIASDSVRQSFDYFSSGNPFPDSVFLPSGLFTSAWFALTVLSILVGKATYSVTPIRNFMIFYFKDLETKPIFVLVKFSGSLILAIAFVFLAVYVILQ